MLGLDLSARHDRWFDALPRSPLDGGTVELCVVRPASDQRQTPPSVRVEPGRGVLGDAWGRADEPEPGTEVSMMNVHVLRAVAVEGARMPLSGDNLVVDLDLSEQNLPTDTRLLVGEEAVLTVSGVPHTGCQAFVDRFGKRAARRVARSIRRGLRGRGVLLSVEQGGEIRAGDPIRVVRSAR